MLRSAYTLLIYGFIVSLGGVIGFMQAHSLPSLIMGLLIGGLCSLFAIICFKNHRLGLLFGGITSGVTALFFFYRFSQSWSFLPGGLMMTISMLVCLRVLRTLFKRRQTQES
jgi:uncharacterized membrane protein (UPF0136 family)